MLKNCLSTLLFFCCIASGFAQESDFSTPVKITGKTPHFLVLGKNQSGILLHKYGRKTSIVEAYNNEMKLRWKKELTFKEPDAQVKGIVVHLNKLHVFYFAQYRGYTKLHLQTFDEKLKPIGKAREIDSLPGLKDLTFKKFRIITSLDKSKTMVYQPHYTEGNPHPY